MRTRAAPAARPLPVLAVALLVGSLAGAGFAYFPISVLCLSALVLICIFLATWGGRCSPAFGSILLGIFLFGIVGAALAHARADAAPLMEAAGSRKVDLVGMITEPVRFGPDHASAIVTVQRLIVPDRSVPLEARIKLTIRGVVPPLIVGDLVEFETRLRAPHGSLNPAGYDYGAYLRRQGVEAVGSVTIHEEGEGLRVLAGGLLPLGARVDHWRGRIRETALRSLPLPLAGIYLALITGETGYLQTDLRDAFMASGTTHILSISGSHLGLIGVVVFGVVRHVILRLPSRWTLRLSRRISVTRVAALATIPAVTLYAFLGGAEVATVRSLIMILIVLAAILLGRPHSLGVGLSLALLLIVTRDPMAPFDISFQLSFLSVLVILLVMERHAHREDSTPTPGGPPDRWGDRMKRWTEEVVLVGVCVTVACVPVVATYFNQVAWVGAFSNLLVVPLVGFLVLPVGLVACLFTLVSGSTELIGGTVMQGLLEALVWVVRLFASVPGAEVRVASPPMWQTAVFFVCLGAAYIRGRLAVRGIAAGLAAGLLLLWVWSPRDLPESARVTFFDVGQGDAALIETSDGRTMLIDAGSASEHYDSGRMAIAPLLWNRGIRRLDIVVATHPQLDHVGGLPFLIRKFSVGELWTDGVPREAVFLQKLDAIVRERHLSVRAVSSADAEVALGECRVRVLNPPSSWATGSGATDGKGLNNLSVVLRLQCVNAFLFTGDVEREAEHELLQSGENLRAAVLKVPHHGARGSVHEPFLKAVGPLIAVVSVGQANPYGHPSLLMTESYQRLGIPVLRTDRHGAVAIEDGASGLHATCEADRKMIRVALGRSTHWTSEAGNFQRLWGCGRECRTMPKVNAL